MLRAFTVLVGIGVGLSLLGAAPAQLIQLPFPATASIEIADNGVEVDPADVEPVWLVGGHSFGTWSSASLSGKRLGSFADSIIVGGVRVDRQRCILYGSHEHESGWAALIDMTAPNETVWRVPFDSSITAGCLSAGMLLLGDEAGNVHRILSESGKLAWSAALHAKMVTAMCGLGASLAASGDWTGSIELFDPNSGKVVGSFKQHRDSILALAASSVDVGDTLRMVSASRDGTVRLWYPAQQRMVRFAQLDSPVAAIAQRGPLEFMVATDDAHLHLVDMTNVDMTALQSSSLPHIASITSMGQRKWLLLDGRGDAEVYTEVRRE